MAANTGNGANVNTEEKPVTAENSPHSPQIAKRSTKRTEKPIEQGEALELLTSALSYCQRSGLSVIGYNEGNALRLSIEGAQYVDGQIVPRSNANEKK